MLTGEIRSQIDQIWNAFWSGGISNPLAWIIHDSCSQKEKDALKG
jgi:hypothetical protein